MRPMTSAAEKSRYVSTKDVVDPAGVVQEAVDISLVVPMHNERASLAQLLDECRAVLEDRSQDWSALGIEAEVGTPRWELLFIDDGSTDESFEVVRALALDHPQVRAFKLRRNLGKAAALSVGFGHARGEVVFSLDGDLQDDPREIPRMLSLLGEGYDLVSHRALKTQRRLSRACSLTHASTTSGGLAATS